MEQVEPSALGRWLELGEVWLWLSSCLDGTGRQGDRRPILQRFDGTGGGSIGRSEKRFVRTRWV